MNIKNKIRDHFPTFIYELAITAYNYNQRRVRYGGNYAKYKNRYKESFNWSSRKLSEFSNEELNKLLNYAKSNSDYYKSRISQEINSVEGLPYLTKEELRHSLSQIATTREDFGIVNYTGGTTGTSTKNIFTRKDVQKRNAFLDAFREKYGYSLKKETAWFSGKEILSKKDVQKNRYFKRDYLGKINYYSTFHINRHSIISYVDSLNKQKPKYLVGFPSSIADIANIASELDLKLTFKVLVVFPTAEKVSKEQRTTIEKFYGAKVIDQYASSEGAPFILECPNGNYHLQQQTGIFELIDIENSELIKELVVTSFSTYGTPLIRYRIGDTVKLSSKVCNCGDMNPIVEEIGGRADDYLVSTNGSRINLGNVSNCTKNVKGIVKFQAVQTTMCAYCIKVVSSEDFTDLEQRKFEANFRERVGSDANIKIVKVEFIDVEKSGKFRIVKRLMD
ncbi:hypothetical protein AB4624_01575 [Vibrio breoganii]